MTLKQRIIEILTEGFATQPFRDWGIEARSNKKEIAEARKENLKHIGIIADEIIAIFKKEVMDLKTFKTAEEKKILDEIRNFMKENKPYFNWSAYAVDKIKSWQTKLNKK